MHNFELLATFYPIHHIFRRKHQEEIAARKKSQHVDPKGDEENLIQNNGKDQEKEPIEDNTEEANKEVSPDKSFLKIAI
jgi:hypothetical protein